MKEAIINKFSLNNVNTTALLFLLPSIIAVLFVLVYPIFYGVSMGFTNRYFSYEHFSFIGLKNYGEILKDPIFFRALLNSLKIAAYTVLFNTILGFGLALGLNSSERYIKFFRTIFFLPWVLPSTVVAFSFRWLYNDYYGFINHILLKYHLIETAVDPLAREGLVWLGIVVPNIWFTYPFTMLVILAALKAIDPNIMEAARIDGAGPWQIFKELTLPTLKPTLIMLTILQVIWEFSSFDLIYLLTRGGPANATLTLSLYIFKKAFAYKQMGYACALAAVMFIILALFIVMYFSLSKNGEKDET